MKLSLNKLKAFEEKLIISTERITTEEEIYDYMTSIGEIYSFTTLSNKLEYFKKCMYYCSPGLSNTMFLEMAQNELALPDERIYIHELMYQFLCNPKHKFLKFNIPENITSKYEPASFSWDISKLIMPVLTAYILAANVSKKSFSVSSFFEKMDRYFYSSSNICDEYVREIYLDLTNEYLGRQYFCTLNSLYEKYSETSNQQQALRNATYSLTRILIECPVKPSIVSTHICSLLEYYQTDLGNHVYSDANTSSKLMPLYAHDAPWTASIETELIKQLTTTFSKLTTPLLTFIENSLDSKSRYGISIKNFDLFQHEFKKYEDDISSIIEESLKNIENTYDSIQNNTDIIKAVKEGRLIFNEAKLNTHKKCLIGAITKYHKCISTKFSTFKTKVKQASNSNTKHPVSLSCETDYFETLKTDIQYYQNILIENNFEGKFKKLSPIFSLHNLGYVENSRYPVDCFYENDILSITYELRKNYCFISYPSCIIQRFKDNGIRFPLSRSDLIDFLLKFEQLVIGL